MKKMHKNTWKGHERKNARLFGAERNPLSGGSGGHSRSDSRHPRLFIESKSRRGGFALTNLWEETQVLARLENKIPVLVLKKVGAHKTWILCEVNDLEEITTEYLIAKDEEK